MNEDVWVVPRKRLFPDEEGVPVGFVSGSGDPWLERMAAGCFLPRREVEDDPSLQQVIPYALVTHAERILLVRRASRGGDARLRDRHSIGLGGHIEPVDLPPGFSPGEPDPVSFRLLVERALARELEEELEIGAPSRAELLGLLKDDSNPVGAVHVGLVFRVRLEAPVVSVRETERLAGALVPPDELARHRDTLESWSLLLADRILPRGGDSAVAGPPRRSFCFDTLRRPT